LMRPRAWRCIDLSSMLHLRHPSFYTFPRRRLLTGQSPILFPPSKFLEFFLQRVLDPLLSPGKIQFLETWYSVTSVCSFFSRMLRGRSSL
jgi:hypothetical protein